MRITVVQVDSEPQEAARVVEQLSRMFMGRPAAVPVAQKAVAALPAPAAQQAEACPTGKEKPSKKAPGPAARKWKSPVQDLVRQALADGPKNNQEIKAWAESHGRKLTVTSISNALYQLRGAGKVRDLDRTRRALA